MPPTYLHRPNLTIITTPRFSSENPPVFRFRLEATKNDASGKLRTVCAIMHNPSYASEDIADRSVQVLERVIFEKNYQELNGVERLIIVNQFAFIQTTDFIGADEQIGNGNNGDIYKAIEESEIILIAWGTDNGFKQRQDDILKMIHDMEGEKILLQTSRHPSRVKYDGFIQEYRTLQDTPAVVKKQRD